jgi:hypothetical protein
VLTDVFRSGHALIDGNRQLRSQFHDTKLGNANGRMTGREVQTSRSVSADLRVILPPPLRDAIPGKKMLFF